MVQVEDLVEFIVGTLAIVGFVRGTRDPIVFVVFADPICFGDGSDDRLLVFTGLALDFTNFEDGCYSSKQWVIV